MSLSDTTFKADTRRRATRPERLVIGGKEFVRNDVIAREQGLSERTLNRDDTVGAPFLMIGGVKYRPTDEYGAFVLGRIQVRNQKSRRRPSRSSHAKADFP
jgi:hypothetical protein